MPLCERRNEMLIVTTEPCCKRLPFEQHKKNCYFEQQKRKMEKFIQKILKQFERALKGE